jgi:hypothetical protein
MNNDEIANKIYEALNKQAFADWYNDGRFDSHITGELHCPSKEEIIADIKKIFRLPS